MIGAEEDNNEADEVKGLGPLTWKVCYKGPILTFVSVI